MRVKATDIVFVGVITLFIGCSALMMLKMGDIQGERDQARAELTASVERLNVREGEIFKLKTELEETNTRGENQQLINETNMELVRILQRALTLCGNGITSDETADICLTLNEAGPAAERANAKLSE